MTTYPDGPFVVYADGASRGNPGPSAIGAIILGPDGRLRHAISQRIGQATNNEAEYRAAIAGLEAALALGAREVELRTDSELLVRQISGRYRVKNPRLVRLHNRIKELREHFARLHVVHIPREQNRRADALANQALDRPAE